MTKGAFEEYGGYASQRVAVVEGGSGWDDSYEGNFAIGLVLEEAAVDPDVARAKLMAAIRPCDVVVEDMRREHDWGASGPIVYDLLIGMSGSMMVTGVAMVVQGLIDRATRGDAPERTAASAEEVSHAFNSFVQSALKGKNAKVDDAENRGDHWYLQGRCSRGRVEGMVDPRGEIVLARLVKEGEDPLVWPTHE